MLKIKGNNISLTRGDSAYITLTINTENDEYVLNEGDVVRIQVRDAPSIGKLIFEADIDTVNDELIWRIHPEQTRNLNIQTYYWDAQLQTANGDVFTFIPVSSFRLMDEVTMENG